MFNIICVLTGSEFTGLVEEAEVETEMGFERTVRIYGHAGRVVFPRGVWKRVDEVPLITSSIEKYPGDETN